MARSFATALLALLLLIAPASAQGGWRPSDEQAAAAQAAADAYFAALEQGAPAQAYAMMAEEMRGVETEAAFVERQRELRGVLSGLIERRFHRITWYKDPAGARPGSYAAFDMVARFQNADRYCGYVIARQLPGGGPFRIIRMEETFLDNANAENMPDPQGVWREMATRFCPGWSETLSPPV